MTSKIISLKKDSINTFAIEPGNEYARNAIWCLDNGYTLNNLTSVKDEKKIKNEMMKEIRRREIVKLANMVKSKRITKKILNQTKMNTNTKKHIMKLKRKRKNIASYNYLMNVRNLLIPGL